jgi:hypothetical protein
MTWLRLLPDPDDRPLLDLVDERTITVPYQPARFSDGSMGAVTRDLDVLADLAATPWNGDAAA